MKIFGITVCVNYADLLAKSLDRWQVGLERLIVVTSPADTATQTLCTHHNVETHLTNVFYANGAKFNKGAGLSEAIMATGWREGADWLLVIDADMVPPTNWREQVEKAKPQPGKLYGSYRWAVPETTPLENCVSVRGRKMTQSWVIGFFSLFHSTDPRVPKDPMFETHWTHAGNFDTSFSWLWGGQDRFERQKHQVFLPLELIHLGEERRNWMGRDRGDGKAQALQQLLGQRRHFHDVDREKVVAPAMPKGKVSRICQWGQAEDY